MGLAGFTRPALNGSAVGRVKSCSELKANGMLGRFDWSGWRGRRQRAQGEREPVSACVVDPGSTAVRILIVETTDGYGTILGWEEVAGSWSRLSPDSAARELETAIRRAEDSAQLASGGDLPIPEDLVVGLPASELRGWSWPIKQGRSRYREPVSERELTALLGRALRLSVNRQTMGAGRGWVLIDAVLTSIALDGLGVTDPVGFRGREIEARVFAALAQKAAVERWRRLAEKLRFASLDLVATPVAVAGSLQEADCILLSVGDETTGLIWSEAGMPLAVTSLPTGGAAISSALSRQWGMVPEKAEALKVAYARGRLADHAARQVREAMIPVLQEWLHQTEDAVADMAGTLERPLPCQIALMGGGSALPEMLEAARLLCSSDRLKFDGPVRISQLEPRSVLGVVNRTELGQTPADTPVLALGAWAGRQGRQPDRPARILAELCERK